MPFVFIGQEGHYKADRAEAGNQEKVNQRY